MLPTKSETSWKNTAITSSSRLTNPPLASREARASRIRARRPFKVVIDPEMRLKLRRALIELIDYHDEALAEHFAEGKLDTRILQGIHRTLRAQFEGNNGKPRRRGLSPARVGFEVRSEEINLNPELRWKRGPGAFGASLL